MKLMKVMNHDRFHYCSDVYVMICRTENLDARPTVGAAKV